jgi:hypothetical protein
MVDNFEEIHQQALAAAQTATQNYLDQHGHADCCGFAWVEVFGVKGNTRLGRTMCSMGFRPMGGYLQLWNPSGSTTQAITAKEEGARAYATTLRNHGITAYMGSRMD